MAAAAARPPDPFGGGIDNLLKELKEIDELTATSAKAKSKLRALSAKLYIVHVAAQAGSINVKQRHAIMMPLTIFLAEAGAYVDFESNMVSVQADTPAKANSLAQNRSKRWMAMRLALANFMNVLESRNG